MQESKLSNILTGNAEEQMITAGRAGNPGVLLDPETLTAFNLLQSDGVKEGFDLKVYSGFRNFNKQLDIWNKKATGSLAVLDNDSKPVNISLLTRKNLMLHILRWSALPGASRHHWGTDIDFYDYNCFTLGSKIDLVPEEYNNDGPFAAANKWINSRIRDGKSYGFFKPYNTENGGVNPEAWHLSWAPLADKYVQALTPNILKQKIVNSPIQLKDEIINNFELIWNQFILNVGHS